MSYNLKSHCVMFTCIWMYNEKPWFCQFLQFPCASTFCFWLLHLDWIRIMGLALLNPTPHVSGFGLQIYFCKTWLPVFFGFRLRIYLSWAWLPVFWPYGFGPRFLECAQIKRPSSYILLVFVFIYFFLHLLFLLLCKFHTRLAQHIMDPHGKTELFCL